MTHPPRTDFLHHRLGFSLIEMVVSLAVVSVLLVGMTSAIVLASRALPSNDGPAAATVASAKALHQLRDELRGATELLNRTPTSVTLHLPDRDGDGRPEVITYAWAGNPGDPLTRAANGNAAVTVIDALDSFALAYPTTDQDLVFPGPPGPTSAEQLLSSFESEDTSNTEDHRLGGDEWIGTFVDPALPSDATVWRVTRALFFGNKDGGSGSTITFELRGRSGELPNETIHDTATIAESAMTDWDWYETTFDSPDFSAGQVAAIVLANHGGGKAGKWSYYTNDSPPSQMFTGDGEGEWSTASTGEELFHYIYGTYDLPSDDWTYTRPRITAVEVTLTHANASATTHHLNIALPNAPEAVAALWEADFGADPTTLDHDADGVADWQDDGTFDVGNLADGRWEATDTLGSWPEGVALDSPFILEVWGEDTVDNGNGGGVRLRFDRDGGLQAYVTIQFDLSSAGQLINVHSKDASGVQVDWVDQTKPAGQSVCVALVVDPVNDTVGVGIDGEIMGSFTYERLSNAGNQDVLRGFADGSTSGVMLDHVRLTTGGTATLTPGAYSTASGSGSSESGESGSGTSGSESAKSSGTKSSGSSNWWENLFK